jgi:hypothetical protein
MHVIHHRLPLQSKLGGGCGHKKRVVRYCFAGQHEQSQLKYSEDQDDAPWHDCGYRQSSCSVAELRGGNRGVVEKVLVCLAFVGFGSEQEVHCHACHAQDDEDKQLVSAARRDVGHNRGRFRYYWRDHRGEGSKCCGGGGLSLRSS